MSGKDWAVMAESGGNWERGVIEKLALEALKEQRRARRWGIFFKLLTFAYLTFLLIMFLDWRGDAERLAGTKHTALVDVIGVIDSKGNASADHVTGALQSAFKDKNTQGVILRINSPGGSPVQAGIIYDEIRRLRAKYPDLPMYAVVEDVCASGGYYIASAADKIYVDKASLVGSIGVLMDQFGFVETLEKLGVERRVLTAGENKAFLDPFAPMQPTHVEHAKKLLGEIHAQFIDVVKKGRGTRLKESPEIFSGLMWSGATSIELGLSDAFGSVDYVAREVIKAEQIVEYTRRDNLIERLAKRFGAGMAETLGLGAASGVRLR
jgi:protease-4